MLTQIIWWMANLLLVGLVLRCVQTRSYRNYPAFFSYLVYVLLENVASFLVYVFLKEHYKAFYWNSQVLSIIVGYFVIWEIYSRTLHHSPGAKKMARSILLLAFVILLARYISSTVLRISGEVENLALLERDLRSVQVFLISGIVLLIGYYQIPIGRNMRGIITGYGLYVGTVMAGLAIQNYLYEQFGVWSETLLPVSYVVALGIWLQALWVHDPVPKPTRDVQLEQDYLHTAEQLTGALLRVRHYVLGVQRS